MNYTPYQCDLLVGAFQIALGRIWDGKDIKNYFRKSHISICSALPDSEAGNLAKLLIHERLEGFFGVRSWLKHRGFLPRNEFHQHYEEVQAYRIAWLKELIKEFSNASSVE